MPFMRWNLRPCASSRSVDDILVHRHLWYVHIHYSDVIMGAMASQITCLAIVYSTVYSDADQGKYQSSASLAFVRGIHRWPVNSPHIWPVTPKMFPFDDSSCCRFFESRSSRRLDISTLLYCEMGCLHQVTWVLHRSSPHMRLEFLEYLSLGNSA